MKRFLALLLIALSMPSYAALVKQSRWTYDGATSFFDSAAAACTALGNERYPSSMPLVPANSSGSTILCMSEKAGGGLAPVYLLDSCPAGSHADPANPGSCICDEGLSESGGQCVPQSMCSARNEAGVANFTVGWTYKDFGLSDDQHYAKSNWVGGKSNMPPASGQVCITGCKADIDAAKPYNEAFAATLPSANGLYRQSVDVNVHYSGDTCTAAESDNDVSKAFDPTTPDQKCEGQQGTIQVGDGPARQACFPAGTTPGAGEKMPEKPANKTPVNGNPAAGDKPLTGDGSGFGGGGRTPSSGNGGNKGGPKGASTPGGTGTGGEGGTGGEEGNEKTGGCGGKDQPKCKIDETGTPDGKDAFGDANAALDKVDADRKGTLDGITNAGDKDTSWGVSFGWLQHGGCDAWNLGTLPTPKPIEMKVDICTIEGYTAPIVSFLWVITTVGMCASLVFGAVNGGKQ